MDEAAEPRPGNGAGATSASPWARKRLLLITPDDVVPECLIHAVEREFPRIFVEQVADLKTACAVFRQPVNLILIDSMFVQEMDGFVVELTRHHPSALVALLHDDNRRPLLFQQALELRTVRGVLPMNLKLDVWLSVIRLMLHGGEYFPVALLQQFARAAPKEEVAFLAAHGRADGGRNGLNSDLTGREIQILEMVSRGLQNKIIASALHLSENTVKIHLHNIITKLGVHNRTQAADMFRKRSHSLLPAEFSRPPPSADPRAL